MMEGIEVLNKELIYETPMWASVITIACLVILVVSCFICCQCKEEFSQIISGTICIACIIVAFAIKTKNPQINTGRYRYEVTIDESVSFDAVLDKYKVIEKKGKIWILEDKESD